MYKLVTFTLIVEVSLKEPIDSQKLLSDLEEVVAKQGLYLHDSDIEEEEA